MPLICPFPFSTAIPLVLLRIAVNARFLLPGKLEGIGWYTHEVLRRMVLAHPEDDFLLLFDRPFDPDFVYGPNATPMVVFPQSRHPFLWYWWFEHAVPKALRRFKAEVFFSPDSYLSLSSSVPTVMTAHDLVPLHHPEQLPFATRHYYRYYLPRFLTHAAHVATVSDYVRGDIIATCGLSPDKVTTVYNGCREGFRPLSSNEQTQVKSAFSEGRDYFFYTGSIHPRKNVHRLIEAFDRFKTATQSPTLLLLAGRFAWQTGDVRAAYEAAAHKSDIRFLGYVPEAQLHQLMGAALALTYVSLSEGFGLPLVEAMYCDVPILASRATSLPEIAGEAALLVDPFSVEAIAQGMRVLHEDAPLRQQLVAAGRHRRQNYRWDASAEQLYRLLAQTFREAQEAGRP